MVNPLREAIAEAVRRPFAAPDGRPSVLPVAPDARLMPAGSVAFRVHADVTTMMIGGIASLLLQMLHPVALSGVWDHSNFRRDMAGRLRRTAAFIAVTTFGARAEAEAAIARVNRIHAAVSGRLPDGRPYAASDPETLAFVGVTETIAFLDAYVRYREPLMPRAEQDRYIAEMADLSARLGAAPMPRTRRAAGRWLDARRPLLAVDARTREVARLILEAPAPQPAMAPAQALMRAAAVDLLPTWARRMHGLGTLGAATPLVRTGAAGLGAVIRWALAPASTLPERR